jgi:hypothetical protein
MDNGYVRNFKDVVVKISDGTTVKGKVNIGDRFHRLSDLFRLSQESFITLVSEESTESLNEVFFINKNYILWAKAED